MTRAARAAWGGVAAILLCAYVLLVHLAQAGIDARAAERSALAMRLDAAQRALASRGAVELARAALSSRLRAAETDSTRDLLVARFLRRAASIANRHAATIASLSVPASPPAAAAGSDSDGFAPIPLDVSVEGRYADVLATMRELSAGDVPALVDFVALARKDANSREPMLSATLRVALEQLLPPDVVDGPVPTNAAPVRMNAGPVPANGGPDSRTDRDRARNG